MTQRLIATVPIDEDGFVEKYYWDDDKPEFDRLHIVRIQDVEANLELNRKVQNDIKRPEKNFEKGIHHVARIPFVTLERWRKTGFDWFNSTDAEKRKVLNRPENAKYRTRKSRM